MIDIVVWDENTETYISNAMKPANVAKVRIDEKNKKAAVIVAEDQLSVAIGKSGQNVRLAGKLTGYELDVSADEAEKKPAETVEEKQTERVESKPVVQKLKKKSDLESSLLEAIEEHGTDTGEKSTEKESEEPKTEDKPDPDEK